MKRGGWVALGVAVLFALHNDFWAWNDGRVVFGLPVGLLYHLVYVAVVAVAMAALVKWCWPRLDEEDPGARR